MLRAVSQCSLDKVRDKRSKVDQTPGGRPVVYSEWNDYGVRTGISNRVGRGPISVRLLSMLLSNSKMT